MLYGDNYHYSIFTEMVLKYKNGIVIAFTETHNACFAPLRADVSKNSVQFRGERITWEQMFLQDTDQSGCMLLHISTFQKSFSLPAQDA